VLYGGFLRGLLLSWRSSNNVCILSFRHLEVSSMLLLRGTMPCSTEIFYNGVDKRVRIFRTIIDLSIFNYDFENPLI